MRHYLHILLAIPAILLLGSLLLAFWATFDCIGGDNQQCSLLQHQFEKLDHAPPVIDLLFLGDSSLGRAVDAQLFARLSGLSGQRVLNLALTGNFNLPSMRNLLAHATSSASIKTVVLMLTPQIYDIPAESQDMPKYQAFPGVLWSARFDWHLLLQTVAEYRTAFIRAAVHELFSRKNVALGIKKIKGMVWGGSGGEPHIVDDYLRPRDKRMTMADLPERFGEASSRYLPSLHAIGNLCRQWQIQCLYLHGTVFGKSAENSGDMIEKINEMVNGSGLTLVNPAPIPVPFEEIGDSVNHVDPPFKSKYTAVVYDRLRPYLPVERQAGRPME
ncbi:MAG: hypothetical protein HQL80_06445 [Magnetococcales bacterium]|nr:hypothetical protein [Magnetococcales bacterium]